MVDLQADKQREFAVEVVRRLREESYEAYWAGGCVRDQLLGVVSKDYDVATTARPEQIRGVFGNRRTIPVGAAFGVVAVVGPRGAGQIEVATFRQDSAYSDGRHPDFVRYTTAEADAWRRDFTINGMFYDPLEDRVIDYVGGQQDLANKVVRAIGEPAQRFAEDKLRLIRAVRFTAMLDFALDPATRQAISRAADSITQVSAERVAAEMRTMLTHRNRAAAMALMAEVGLLAAIAPPITPHGPNWESTLAVLAQLDRPSFPLALAALVRLFVDPEGCAALCRRWKLSNHELELTCWLVEHQSVLRKALSVPWPKLQRLLISKNIGDLLALEQAVARAEHYEPGGAEHCLRLLDLPPEELNPLPLLTGEDLIRHGVPRGRQYKFLLDAVRDAQLEKQITNKAEALMLVDRLAGQRGLPDADTRDPEE